MAGLVLSAAILAAFGPAVPAQSESWLAELRARAESGEADAQYQLALRLRAADVIPYDDTEAAAWLRRAADQDHMNAQFMLGTMYIGGRRGMPQDDGEAAAWFHKAVEAGHPDAPFLLGNMYDEGRGVFKDRVLACMWYILAAQRASDRNREVYERVLKLQVSLLTRAEVVEAQRLARAWNEGHPQGAVDIRVR